MRSGITAPGSGITTLGIGISSVFVESGIKIVNVFGIRDQNSQCFCDQGLKFSTFLWSGIKIWGKNTGSVKKKKYLVTTLMFLCVTESWLSSQIHDPAVAIPGYNLFRKDCTFEAGDGVCVSFLKNLFLVLDWTNVISLTVSLCGFL